MTNRLIALSLCMFGILASACDAPTTDEEVGDEEVLAQGRQAITCVPSTLPPTPDATGTLVGSPTDVDESGAASGCDLFTVRADADPPGDRARYVDVSSQTVGNCPDNPAQYWVWKGEGGPIFSWTRVALTVDSTTSCVGSSCVCFADAVLDLGATNDHERIVVGGHHQGGQVRVIVSE
jgi:hypothetical protein